MKLSDLIRLINRAQRSRLIWKSRIAGRWIFVRIMGSSWDESEMNLRRSRTRFWDVKSFGDVPATRMPAVTENEENDKQNDG